MTTLPGETGAGSAPASGTGDGGPPAVGPTCWWSPPGAGLALAMPFFSWEPRRS
jgi:hypothetical protein